MTAWVMGQDHVAEVRSYPDDVPYAFNENPVRKKQIWQGDEEWYYVGEEDEALSIYGGA